MSQFSTMKQRIQLNAAELRCYNSCRRRIQRQLSSYKPIRVRFIGMDNDGKFYFSATYHPNTIHHDLRFWTRCTHTEVTEVRRQGVPRFTAVSKFKF